MSELAAGLGGPPASAVDEFVADYLDDDGEPFWPPDDHVGVDSYDNSL